MTVHHLYAGEGNPLLPPGGDERPLLPTVCGKRSRHAVGGPHAREVKSAASDRGQGDTVKLCAACGWDDVAPLDL